MLKSSIKNTLIFKYSSTNEEEGKIDNEQLENENLDENPEIENNDNGSIKSFVIKYWKIFKKWNLNHIKEHSKLIIISYAVILLTLGAFLTFDLVTKHVGFNFADEQINGRYLGTWEFARRVTGGSGNEFVIYWGNFLGFRSIMNYGVTVAGSSEINVDGIHALSLIATIFILISIYFYPCIKKTDYFRVAALGILVAGVLGNTVDRFAFGAVRDFLFTPYTQNSSNTFFSGTFNFADTFIIVGIISFVISMIALYFVNREKKDKDDNNNYQVFEY
ncbi:signal peptidase II [Mycoplasma testudineum]|uniref:Signal peptidase II n=1 Tax=Mycoplasma testudineum TaxID=244584 RepID=A0A4R6IGS5_9MOLU|nr:signal peptidase II [Mycoplasma testudineum]OYD27176.1 hypothetical protein CG473_00855 [Mycoplasma testudineum]TDO21066.1 signal peptidase II [Mycoplasma testudineum]